MAYSRWYRCKRLYTYNGSCRKSLFFIDAFDKNKPQILNLNIGTGKGTSVKELVNIFEDVNKCNIPFVFKERRDGDVSICVADNSYSKKVLGWIPTRNIKDMCRDGWKWMSISKWILEI